MSHFYQENPPASWEECGSCGGYHPPASQMPQRSDLATALYEGDCRHDLYNWPSKKAIAHLIANPLPEDAESIAKRGRTKPETNESLTRAQQHSNLLRVQADLNTFLREHDNFYVIRALQTLAPVLTATSGRPERKAGKP